MQLETALDDLRHAMRLLGSSPQYLGGVIVIEANAAEAWKRLDAAEANLQAAIKAKAEGSVLHTLHPFIGPPPNPPASKPLFLTDAQISHLRYLKESLGDTRDPRNRATIGILDVLLNN